MPGKLTKAVILARGLGTRMQREAEGVELDEETKRAANTGMKAMIPVEGRPFLDYGIQELLDAGLSQICLVIGPSHDTLRNYYAGLSARAENFTISFAYQEHADGTAKAVAAAREFVGEDEFIVVNCDKIRVTGRKLDQKIYYRHSGYPGGLKSETLREMLRQHPERVIQTAVRGMLPKNRLGRKMIKKLKIYAGDTHPHQAQKPKVFKLQARRGN